MPLSALPPFAYSPPTEISSILAAASASNAGSTYAYVFILEISDLHSGRLASAHRGSASGPQRV